MLSRNLGVRLHKRGFASLFTIFLGTALLAAPTASAVVSCNYVDLTNTLTVALEGGDSATVKVANTAALESAEQILVNNGTADLTCLDGAIAATVGNTDFVNINGDGGNNNVTILRANASASKFRGEAQEYFNIALAGGTDSLTVSNGAFPGYIIAGRNEVSGKNLLDWADGSSKSFTGNPLAAVANAEFTGLELVTLQGSPGNDFLEGNHWEGGVPEGGSNILGIATYALTINGGAGTDTMNGGSAADTFNGGTNTATGPDVVTYKGRAADLTVSLDGAANDGDSAGPEGDNVLTTENVTGGLGDDTITGDALVNKLDGGPGGDTVNGGLGNDILYADNSTTADGGVDTLNGGDGNDALYSENDTVGGETFSGGANVDTVYSHLRTDDLNVSLDGVANDGAPSVPGTSEVQTLTVFGDTGSYTLSFGASTTAPIAFDATAPTMQAELELLMGIGAGNVAVSGGPGDAGGTTPYTVTFQGALAAMNVAELTADAGMLMIGIDPGMVTPATTTPGVATIPAENDNVDATNENLFTGSGDDTLTGNAVGNLLDGRMGSDTFNGEAGNDTIKKTGYIDNSATPGDVVNGGAGIDTAMIYRQHAAFTVGVRIDQDGVADDGQLGEFDNIKSDVENVHSGNGPDIIIASTGNNVIYTYGGDDYIYANAGNDVVYGGPGADDMYGLAGADKLNGYTGNDWIVGGLGGDTLSGYSGNDVLKAVDSTKDVVAASSGTDACDIDSIDVDTGCEAFI